MPTWPALRVALSAVVATGTRSCRPAPRRTAANQPGHRPARDGARLPVLTISAAADPAVTASGLSPRPGTRFDLAAGPMRRPVLAEDRARPGRARSHHVALRRVGPADPPRDLLATLYRALIGRGTATLPPAGDPVRRLRRLLAAVLARGRPRRPTGATSWPAAGPGTPRRPARPSIPSNAGASARFEVRTVAGPAAEISPASDNPHDPASGVCRRPRPLRRYR